ncbi:helix-turn-helix domain-containing protein [Oscillospiraceae bacterium PP1C4]
MNYFNVSSSIFEYELTPSELMTYCALSSIKNCLNYSVSCAQALSDRTGLSSRTVYRAIENLQDKGLITKRNRYRYDGTKAANGFTVAPMTGRKFKVDRRIWNHKLDASAFAVYLYLVKTADNHSKQAHPCLRKISDALNLCRNTVIAKVRLLHDRMLLVKENRRSERTNRFVSNRHTLLELSAGFICPLFARSKAKKKERIAVRSFKGLHSFCSAFSKLYSRIPSIFSLDRMKGFFKGKRRLWRDFLHILHIFLILVVHFWQNKYYTHLGYSKRKNNIQVYSQYNCNIEH